MNLGKLNGIANRIVASGKGILDANESTGSITMRFQSIKLDSTALQANALKAWGGKPENVAAARKAFAYRAKMNALAATGKWTQDGEKAP